MSEYTNGTAPVIDLGRLRGRAASPHPAITLSSGHTLEVRRMASGTMAQLRQQAYKELAHERPTPPVQAVEVAPPTRPGEPAVTREVERASDPDYLEALKAWEGRVNQATAMKWIRLVQSYAVVTPTDAEAVAAYRAAMAAAGVEVPDDDREVWLWSIVAVAPEDQRALTAFILGVSEPSKEAVQAHKESFRGDVPGAAPGAVGDAPGA